MAKGLTLRRHGLLAVLAGCAAGLGGGSCAGVGSETFGKGGFVYICDCRSSPTSDAWCDANPTGSTLPDVAVGASFAIATDGASVEPAVPTLANKTATGWAAVQPGWLGFIYGGGDDYTHILALNVARIRVDLASATPDASLSPSRVGPQTAIVATALSDYGTILAGTIPCSFESSDASVAIAVGQGRVGHLRVQRDGDVTITATCLGKQAQLALHVELGPNAGVPDAGGEVFGDGATDAGNDGDAPGAGSGAESGSANDSGSSTAAGGG
jgi:hypothetical protein